MGPVTDLFEYRSGKREKTSLVMIGRLTHFNVGLTLCNITFDRNHKILNKMLHSVTYTNNYIRSRSLCKLLFLFKCATYEKKM